MYKGGENMEKFKIQKLNNKNEYLILSTSYISPLDNIFSLQDSLIKLGCKGKIYIDLLLCNGLDDNRYFETDFDGEKIDLRKITICSNIKEEVKSVSRKFYKENNNLLSKSILPKAHCYIIMNGLI